MLIASLDKVEEGLQVSANLLILLEINLSSCCEVSRPKIGGTQVRGFPWSELR